METARLVGGTSDESAAAAAAKERDVAIAGRSAAAGVIVLVVEMAAIVIETVGVAVKQTVPGAKPWFVSRAAAKPLPGRPGP